MLKVAFVTMLVKRWRNGSSPNISRPNGHQMQTHTPRRSYPVFLVKKCSYAKALFVTVLLSWLGLVAVFLSQLPQHHTNDNNAAISPLTARDNLLHLLREPSFSHKNSIGGGEELANHRPSRKIARSWIASYLVSKLPEFANRKTAISPHLTSRENKGKRRPLHKQKVGVHPDRVSISRKEHHLIRTVRKQLKSNQQSTRNRMANVLMPAEENAKQSNSAPSSEDTSIDANNAASFQPRLRPQKLQIKEIEQVAFESIRQSTRVALISSDPHEQKPADVSKTYAQSIPAFFSEDYFNPKSSMDSDDDSLDTYYAADDDTIRGSGYKKRPDGHEPICRTPSFYRLYRPTCNELHSVASGYQWLTGDDGILKNSLSRYLGSGAYRQVFVLERQFASNSEEVILKSMKRFPIGSGKLEQRAAYNPDDTLKDIELYDDMRKDSMVMEQLTSSNRIANIYSFCATSSLVEYAPGNLNKYVMPTDGMKEVDDDDPTPVNNIGAEEKLEMSLELAIGLAAMHGHSGGVIANVDVQLGQFSRGKDGLIKILDFNRAEAMLYDEIEEDYCKFENGSPPDGSLRSPEEIEGAPLDEKIDVYSLGNVFYSILTGLIVNRDYSISQAHSRIRNGITEEIEVAFFESRSPAELALVEVIQWCWTFEAEDRPSIFEVVNTLEEAVTSQRRTAG